MSGSESGYTAQQFAKLRGYHGSLIAHRQVLDDIAREVRTIPKPPFRLPNVVPRPLFEVLRNEINNIQQEFPGLVPLLIEYQLAAEPPASGLPQTFDTHALRAYVAAAAARLAAVLEAVRGDSPVTEKLDFSFVRDATLREILERDWDEAQRAYVAQCWKSVVILSGGAVEALLLDRLLQEPARTPLAKNAPKNRELDKWDLSELIKVSVELDLVEPVAETVANAVRQYRNLVHPGAELRGGLRVEKLEAESGLNVFKTVCRDLAGNTSLAPAKNNT
jgi:hypothetical protein